MREKIVEIARPTNSSENQFADIMDAELDRDLGNLGNEAEPAYIGSLGEILKAYALKRNEETIKWARMAIDIILLDSERGLRNAIHRRNPKISEEDLDALFREVDQKAGLVDSSSIVDPKDFEDEDDDDQKQVAYG